MTSRKLWRVARERVVTGAVGVLVLALLAVGCAGGGSAEQAESAALGSPAPTEIVKTIFAQSDADPDQELYLYQVIIPAGEKIAAHEHPGLQMAHIAEGSLEFEVIEGTATVIRDAGTEQETTEEVSGQVVTLEAGDGVIEPAGTVHGSRNPGEVPTRIVISSLFERGAEMSSPAPQPSPTV